MFESVVPFGKGLSWLARRAAGLVTSSLGALVLVAGSTLDAKTPPVPGKSEAERYLWSVRQATSGCRTDAAAMPHESSFFGTVPHVTVAAAAVEPSSRSRHRSDSSDTHNSLGLEGVSSQWATGSVLREPSETVSMAPDIDGDEPEGTTTAV